MAEFALVGGFGRATQLRGHGLHAVADAQDRQAAVEHLLRRARRAVQRGRFRAARQDDALGAERGDLGRVVVPGPDFAVHPDLADAAGDQLRVLRAEVEDQDLVVMDVWSCDSSLECEYFADVHGETIVSLRIVRPGASLAGAFGDARTSASASASPQPAR